MFRGGVLFADSTFDAEHSGIITMLDTGVYIFDTVVD